MSLCGLAGTPSSFLLWFISSGLLVSHFPGSAEPSGSFTQELHTQVQEIIDGYFGAADSQARKSCASRLAAILSRPDTAKNAEMVIEALPSAAQYHATRLELHLGRARRANGLREGMQKEGYELELDYLVGRVEHAARRDDSEEAMSAVTEQISQIFRVYREELGTRLGGEGGAEVIEMWASELEETWQTSKDSMFNSYLSRPLSPVELESVETSLRQAIAKFPVLQLSKSDLSDTVRLKELRVAELGEEFMNSLFLATRIANQEFSVFAARRKAWQDKLEWDIARARAAQGVRVLEPGSEPKVARPKKKMRREATRAEESEPETDADAADAQPMVPDRSRTSSPAPWPSWRWAALVGLVVVVGAAFALIRRRMSRRGA